VEYTVAVLVWWPNAPFVRSTATIRGRPRQRGVEGCVNVAGSPWNRRLRDKLLPLAELARELGVHVRTLQAAARTGRLETQFTVRSVGRPMRFASQHPGERFVVPRHYRCFSGQEIGPTPLPTVPVDYDKRLRAVRRRRGLTQDALARGIGAAGKAVIYQWESRKRTPSPVLRQGVLELDGQPAPR
jgi:hypothetical protein